MRLGGDGDDKRPREGGCRRISPLSRSMGYAEDTALAVVRINEGKLTILPLPPAPLLRGE